MADISPLLFIYLLYPVIDRFSLLQRVDVTSYTRDKHSGSDPALLLKAELLEHFCTLRPPGTMLIRVCAEC